MKTIALLLALWTVSVGSASAQDAKGGATQLELIAPKKAPAEKKPPVAPPQPKNELLGRPVVYGGFLTDFARAETKRPLLNLATPIDPKKDLENIWFDPANTNKIKGVVFFSIKF